MGDEQGKSGIAGLVFFLDENHCRNRRIIEATGERGIVCETHLEHFDPGTEDTAWLPVIAGEGVGEDQRSADVLLLSQSASRV
jgi:hypothetical protein